MFENFDCSVLDDPTFKEDAVREEIIAPLLKRLGYDASGQTRIQRSAALSHPFVHIGTLKQPVKIIPDYTLWHADERVLILDAKRPNENILRSRHVEQAYSYAIHPEVRCKHFALCNGKLLAVFHVNELDPIFVVGIEDYDRKWGDIERFLTPQNLLNPMLRDFLPDMGLHAMKLGIASNVDIVFLECRLDLLSKVNDNLYTVSTACDFEGMPHLTSFDFEPSFFEPILSCLAWPLASQLRNALSRSPFCVSLDLMLSVDWTTRLGAVTRGAHDLFVPFTVTEVIASKLDRTPTVGEQENLPSYVFRLRRAFESLQSGELNSVYDSFGG